MFVIQHSSSAAPQSLL